MTSSISDVNLLQLHATCHHYMPQQQQGEYINREQGFDLRSMKKRTQRFFLKNCFYLSIVIVFSISKLLFFFVFVILSNCCYFYKSYHVDNLTSHSVICVCVWVFIDVRRKKLPLIKKLTKNSNKHTHSYKRVNLKAITIF